MKWAKVHRAQRASIGVIAVTTIAALTACGTATSEQPAFDPLPVIVPDAKLAAAVPPSIRTDGRLIIATDPTYPPMEFMEGGRKRGADIDLGRAIAQTLQLEADFHDIQFSNVVPSVAVNRYELGMSALWADNPTALLANMVTYMKAGVQLAGRTGRQGPSQGQGMCGHSVSVEEGTEYIDTMVALSKSCRASGRQTITIRSTDNQEQATALLADGKVDAMLADSPAVTYAVNRSAGKLAAIGQPVDVRPYGIAVSPTYPQLLDVIKGALQRLIESNVYQRILERWGLQANAINDPQVLIGKHSELLEMSSATPSG